MARSDDGGFDFSVGPRTFIVLRLGLKLLLFAGLGWMLFEWFGRGREIRALQEAFQVRQVLFSPDVPAPDGAPPTAVGQIVLAVRLNESGQALPIHLGWLTPRETARENAVAGVSAEPSGIDAADGPDAPELAE